MRKWCHSHKWSDGHYRYESTLTNNELKVTFLHTILYMECPQLGWLGLLYDSEDCKDGDALM